MNQDKAADRLERQIEFIIEIDKLKAVLRRNYLTAEPRRENDAEHSWQLAVMAMLLSEHASEPNLDMLRLVKMALVHDLVEIDAGDSFLYAVDDPEEKIRKEQAAADRIFAMLPPDQADEMRALWDEFEAGVTPEASFAKALDRLQPMLLNYHTQGRAWKEHLITADRPLAINPPIIANGSHTLADFAERLLENANRMGYFHTPAD